MEQLQCLLLRLLQLQHRRQPPIKFCPKIVGNALVNICTVDRQATQSKDHVVIPGLLALESMTITTNAKKQPLQTRMMPEQQVDTRVKQLQCQLRPKTVDNAFVIICTVDRQATQSKNRAVIPNLLALESMIITTSVSNCLIPH